MTVSIRPCLRSVLPAGCMIGPSHDSMLEVASLVARLQPHPVGF